MRFAPLKVGQYAVRPPPPKKNVARTPMTIDEVHSQQELHTAVFCKMYEKLPRRVQGHYCGKPDRTLPL